MYPGQKVRAPYLVLRNAVWLTQSTISGSEETPKKIGLSELIWTTSQHYEERCQSRSLTQFDLYREEKFQAIVIFNFQETRNSKCNSC